MDDNYSFVLAMTRLFDKDHGLILALGLIVVWLHATIGVWNLIRFKVCFERVKLVFYTVMILIPLLALFGYISGGKETQFNQESKANYQNKIFNDAGIDYSTGYKVTFFNDSLTDYYKFLPLFVLICLTGRIIWKRARKRITVSYSSGLRMQVLVGSTLLEASQWGSIPHASLCGGRGRCTTCRVQIYDGLEQLPERNRTEAEVALRLGWGANLRLACQTRPRSAVKVRPLFNVFNINRLRKKTNLESGKEMELAFLFVDLRDFTKFSEGKFAFDVVHVLNEYFFFVTKAIERCGGRIDKYIGDGLMATFLSNVDNRVNCLNALTAAKTISTELKNFNRTHGSDFQDNFRIGMGLHSGLSVVGTIGYGEAS